MWRVMLELGLASCELFFSKKIRWFCPYSPSFLKKTGSVGQELVPGALVCFGVLHLGWGRSWSLGLTLSSAAAAARGDVFNPQEELLQ